MKKGRYLRLEAERDPHDLNGRGEHSRRSKGEDEEVEGEDVTEPLLGDEGDFE